MSGTSEQALQLALQHHQAGRLGQAEQLYRQVLAQQPWNVSASYLLGLVAYQAGRYDAALELVRQTIALKPDHAEAHVNLGNVLRAQGHIEEAIAAYRQAITFKPDLAEAHCNLGTVLRDKGELDDAIAAYRRAIAIRPSYVEAYINLGSALRNQELFDEAIAVCRRAIALRPDFARAYHDLGVGLWKKGQLDPAIAALRQAIALQPGYAEAYNNIGNVLWEKGQLDEAIAAYQQSIARKPDLAEAHNNLAIALRDKGQPDQAIAACQKAIALKPDYAEAYTNLGLALWDIGKIEEATAAHRQAIAIRPNYPDAFCNLGATEWDKGRLDDAIAAYRQAIALKPDSAEAHYNLACALLARGDFPEGWEEQEWRWQGKKAVPTLRNFSQPQWDGSPLRGRTILLHAEQGFGDTIQFIRYLPAVVERGGQIIIECQLELRRLLQRMAGGRPVVVRGEALPPFDVHCPLLSLPKAFGTTLQSIPQNVPYLHADAREVEKWRSRISNDSVKVGLAWAGNPAHKNDRNRSIPLAGFAPLARIPGVRFYSLQKAASSAPLDLAHKSPAGMGVTDWTSELNDFADTTALIAHLDLVIAVDTAVAHLAGAMGKPVWMLLPFRPDWRWMRHRQDTPWYPNMRLFRQPAIGDWDSVLRDVAESLRGLLS